MMQMVMIVYNEAMDEEVMEGIERRGIKNFTKIGGVSGRGDASGTHLGNDIWPGRNNLLYIACGQEEARRLLEMTEELRGRLGKEGIKAFAWDLRAK